MPIGQVIEQKSQDSKKQFLKTLEARIKTF